MNTNAVDDEVWRGGVNTWECDEMGHMNTRFYVARSVESLATLFARLGVPGLFSLTSPTTLSISEMHIRFLREARAGAALRMTAGLTAIGENSADVVMMMYDSATGEMKATFRAVIGHVASSDGEAPAAWPEVFLARARPHMVEVPAQAAPRSIDVGPVAIAASFDRAAALGLARIAMGVVGSSDADAFGRMQPHTCIGAVADGIRQITTPLRNIVVDHAEIKPARYGGAALEFRIMHRQWPRVGDCYEVWSGLQKVDGNIMSLVHWMLDPVTNHVFCTMQSIAVTFDLDARRIVPISPAARAELGSRTVPELAL